MRNLGLFLPVPVASGQLSHLGHSLGGQPAGLTLQFGKSPEGVYLDLSTDLANGCFDAEEFEMLRTQLGFPPAAYVSIHMDSTASAFDRALKIARSIQAQWGGTIDYSGAGGSVENPFQPLGVDRSTSS